MAAKPIRMDQIRILLQLKQRGESIRTISRMLGMSRNTVRGYLRKIDQGGLSPSSLMELSDTQLATHCYRDDGTLDQGVRMYALQHWLKQYGDDLSNRHVTRQLLWEEYRHHHPNGFGYTWFCRHLNEFASQGEVTMHFDHKPADRLMVDFAGDGLSYHDPLTHELVKTHVWVAVLPASNYTYVEAVPNQRQEHVCACLQHTFAYLGGVPRSVLFDNMRSAVKRADRYEPTFTELMQALSVHYRCTFMATRIKKPRDKAHVETGVQVVYQRIYARLRHRTFYSLGELNTAIYEALEQLNARPLKGKPYSRKDLFDQYERTELTELPTQGLNIYRRAQVKVQRNYHVILGQDMHQYSVPFRYVGKTVRILWSVTQVEIYEQLERIAVHPYNPRRYGYTTDGQHMPSNHQAIREQQGWDAPYFLTQAQCIGPATHHAITVILAGKAFPEQTYKSCLGVLRLADKYTHERVECVCALLTQSPKITYLLIKTMLEKRRDHPLIASLHDDHLTADHANVRGSSVYQ